MKGWRYIKTLSSEDIVFETEKQLGFKFDESYVEFVKIYNGGRPPISVFDTDITKERTIKSFLSLNPADLENIINLNKYINEVYTNLIAFAIDSFGNYICFERTNHTIIFLDYETGKTEFVAECFSEFLKKLDGGDA